MSEPAKLGGPYAERRTAPRYMFIATADIIEPATNTHISGRVSEISRFGCYVDILNTLPKDTPAIVVNANANGSIFWQSVQNICYVDILNTLPKDTAIRVRIYNDSGSFESAGKIIYVQENMGMGVGFVEPAEDQLQI